MVTRDPATTRLTCCLRQFRSNCTRSSLPRSVPPSTRTLEGVLSEMDASSVELSSVVRCKQRAVLGSGQIRLVYRRRSGHCDCYCGHLRMVQQQEVRAILTGSAADLEKRRDDSSRSHLALCRIAVLLLWSDETRRIPLTWGAGPCLLTTKPAAPGFVVFEAWAFLLPRVRL